MKYLVLLVISLLVFSCNSKSELEKEIDNIPVTVDILRFDKIFAAAKPEDLARLKKEYPVFFPKQFHDSIWLYRMEDTLQHQLNKAVAQQFPNENKIEKVLHPLFQHIKYYFPQFKSPTVVTVTSDVDYNNKVILADTLLILSLDTYLGADHEFYGGIKKYISQNLKESQIGPDVAEADARQLVSKPNQRSLLAQMVFFGKELYLKDLWLPETSDADKIGYTEAQLQWAKENEAEMWRFFVENEVLYSTDAKLPARFINPAPFSKFYLEIDNDSPGMIGRYLGWQIVRAYMKNNETSVDQLLVKNTETLFKESKYKPQKQ